MKYSKWIGIVACLALVAICFMPWTYHADIGKTFTGFFSEKNAYGRPGKFFIFFCSFFILMSVINKVWARRVNLFMAAIMVAYAIKTYILYASCYNAYCPEKQVGIYLLIVCNLLILATAIFPDMKLESKEEN